MKVLVSDEKSFENNNMKVTCLVLLSAYNGGKYIQEQLQSIFNQKDIIVDILVRDDGSRDNTLSILESMSAQHPGAMNIIVGNNVGIHDSFADLIEAAPDRYDFYAFSDQDDIWDDDKLFSAIQVLNKFNVPFYCGCSRLVDSEGMELNTATSNPKAFIYYMGTTHKVLSPGVQGCTMVLRKDFFSDIQRNYPRVFGHDTWIPIVASYFYGCVYDKIPRMNYRQHNDSWTGNREKRIKQLTVNIGYFFRGLERYSFLARELLDNYGDRMHEYEIDYLTGLANKGPFCKRIKNLVTYRYAKDSAIKTLLFRGYYLFGR